MSAHDEKNDFSAGQRRSKKQKATLSASPLSYPAVFFRDQAAACFGVTSAV